MTTAELTLSETVLSESDRDSLAMQYAIDYVRAAEAAANYIKTKRLLQHRIDAYLEHTGNEKLPGMTAAQLEDQQHDHAMPRPPIFFNDMNEYAAYCVRRDAHRRRTAFLSAEIRSLRHQLTTLASELRKLMLVDVWYHIEDIQMAAALASNMPFSPRIVIAPWSIQLPTPQNYSQADDADDDDAEKLPY